MATIITLPSGNPFNDGDENRDNPRKHQHDDHRDLAFWMQRVLKELHKLRSSPDPDTIHDLRVAIRRCRSVGAVLSEVDPHPAWREMRKLSRKLFRALGASRDAHVLAAWTKKLGSPDDAIRAALEATFHADDEKLRNRVNRQAAKFDDKAWKRLERTLRKRARLVSSGSLAAECLALERFEAAKELHARALRTHKPNPWHRLRIGIKRFRYTVESLLPQHYAAWSGKLKRLQDLLGEVHDLDVLVALVKKTASPECAPQRKSWEEMIEQERHERIETYRQLTLGKTSLWSQWRQGLPHNGRLEAASMARLRATARAADSHLRRTAHVARVACALFDQLRRIRAGSVFVDPAMRRILSAAGRLHGVGANSQRRSRHKTAQKLLKKQTVPPSWSPADWKLLVSVVRYHRGAEPKPNSRSFAKLSDEQQKNLRALAGILRLARALRKAGVQAPKGFRAQQTAGVITIRIPGLPDSADIAAHLASAKHLLETYLEKPVVIQPAVAAPPVLAVSPLAIAASSTSG